MRQTTIIRVSGALVSIAAFAGFAAAQQPIRFAGSDCVSPPVMHCPDKDCPADRVANQGSVVEMKTRRTYFLDYRPQGMHPTHTALDQLPVIRASEGTLQFIVVPSPTAPRWCEATPAQNRLAFALSNNRRAVGTFVLPFWRTGAMNRHAQNKRRKGTRTT
jgi:hypothetical protein